MKDVLGREIRFGDQVVHYTRQYSGTMEGTLHVVTEVYEDKVKCVKEKKHRWQRRATWFTNPEYVVVVDARRY